MYSMHYLAWALYAANAIAWTRTAMILLGI